jgi:acyl carrier protein
MTATPLAEAVATALAQLVGRPVRTTERLIDALALDSLHLYELAIALDELVPGIELPDHLPVDVLTVGDIAALLDVPP